MLSVFNSREANGVKLMFLRDQEESLCNFVNNFLSSARRMFCIVCEYFLFGDAANAFASILSIPLYDRQQLIFYRFIYTN